MVYLDLIPILGYFENIHAQSTCAHTLEGRNAATNHSNISSIKNAKWQEAV